MESIDVFDTAIFRDVYQPTDIFKLIEDTGITSFQRKRINAEAQASKSNKFYTIQDIYKHLPGLDYNEEIKMEMQHIYPNATILEMYKQNPQNYVFISDMYLPAKTIQRFLEKCGYENPKVFVSCEEKCNKGSGILFEKVQKRVGQITKHYGDNYKSDIMGARKVGIQPTFEPALHKRGLNLPPVKSPLLKKYCAALEVSKESPLTKLAKWYAPLIYEFTKWVVSKREEGQHIYFLSRDMFMPYLIAKGLLNQEDIHYLYCSRRSLAPLFIDSKDCSLREKMNIVLTQEEFDYKKKRGTKDTLEYLRRSGISDNDIIVDIGYSGSTQFVIEKFLNIKLKGLYMQLDQALPHKMDMEMFLNRYALTYRFLAEFILTSPEDCVEDYQGAKPVLRPDNETRKEYARHINSIIVNDVLFRRINRMNLSIFDIEQMLIHIQNYPSYEMMKLFNQPILTNRQKIERGINFDRNAILRGKLLDCYRKSYAKPLFKKMLEMDDELKGLVELLPS